MFFIDNPYLRKLEAFMQVPNFPSKGVKTDFDKNEDEIPLVEIESIIVKFEQSNENLKRFAVISDMYIITRRQHREMIN